jgi:hypothetical protein
VAKRRSLETVAKRRPEERAKLPGEEVNKVLSCEPAEEIV